MSDQNAVDISQIKVTELPTAEFPGGKNQPFRIFFDLKAHTEAWAHTTGTVEVEVCGVLVGKWARDAVGPYVHVEHVIRGEAAASKLAEVTFTHETWSKINARMDSDFADLSIVGWYHSHPDFGIFLSDRDRFIQESFFSNPGQIALVIDPVRKTEGVFIWKNGKTELAPNFWVGDESKTSVPAGEEPNRSMGGHSPATAGATSGSTAGPPGDPSAGDGRFLNWVTSALFGLCLFLLGALVMYYFGDRSSDITRERIEADANARALVRWGYRPGLKDRLDQSLQRCIILMKRLDQLTQEQLDATTDEAQKKEIRDRWIEAREDIRDIANHLMISREQYIPSERDLARYKAYLEADRRKLEKEKEKEKQDQKAKPDESAPKKTEEQPK